MKKLLILLAATFISSCALASSFECQKTITCENNVCDLTMQNSVIQFYGNNGEMNGNFEFYFAQQLDSANSKCWYKDDNKKIAISIEFEGKADLFAKNSNWVKFNNQTQCIAKNPYLCSFKESSI